MRKIIIYILITGFLLFLCTVTTRAQGVSDSSASLKIAAAKGGFDYRVENLREFLEKYNSPLAVYAEEFVTYADLNGLDYRLVPSISGVESTFGKRIPADSYNAYGWANGEYSFTSWEDSIAHVSKTLRIAYIDRGAASIAKIAKRYAPPSVTWAGKVTFFVKKIDFLPLDFDII
ncbi:MAG: seg [Microgenomates group bacterium GW2011_GWC1_43_13]|uniref:Uncharacterized protein n=3 Tax=Candidatus Woeseibacteriota TaxID=1752722 RepID=A0A837ID55_9BACT|nr:MAG: seg [Microgenomates group bacterium GW2011_GWC1_43_13]KKT32632.1 MAG: hypothetical protein UW20_C0011G0002 [Candidatus Woesebacteria bacterium GW2011_GWB1_44_11]KKT54206.1 MAG: hypothetical protein UW47_C0008G0005 [Candidatus Woesebacteria bacterium GW2011_GWA1_44_23]OGM76260.1 MAG: hypothetical protein A2208_02275 [Candidatus Woesebacteria bacterium RIFOXYA1_FULL_43_16]OGM84930.1 MAG: hypothetical protein A2421_00215 [Candidatus Woesebacteria bacterium RIFOXYC1_FULL_43_18]OGM87826.1 M